MKWESKRQQKIAERYWNLAGTKGCWFCKYKFGKPPVELHNGAVRVSGECAYHLESTHGIPHDLLGEEVVKRVYESE